MKLFTRTMAAAGLSMMTAFAQAAPIDLGQAESYTLLGAGPGLSHHSGLMQLGSEAIIHGNVGGRGFIGLSSGVEIHGDLDGGFVSAAPDVTVSGDINVMDESYWDTVYSDLVKASDEARSLGGTSLSSVTETTVFNSTGDLTVFDIDGSILLEGDESLTIKGDANDTFIINVSERLHLDSLAAILLDGVHADNVLFNFYGAGSDDSAYNNHLATIVGGAEFSGTFIAPRAYWQIGDGAIMEQTRVLANGIQGNLQVVRGITPPTTSVPEPGAWALMLLALFGLRFARRK